MREREGRVHVCVCVSVCEREESIGGERQVHVNVCERARGERDESVCVWRLDSHMPQQSCLLGE